MIFGLLKELEHRYQLDSKRIWTSFCNTFKTLPLAATLHKKVLCVHSGLSPEVSTLEDLQAIDRFSELNFSGALCDLLFSEPDERKKGQKTQPTKKNKNTVNV